MFTFLVILGLMPSVEAVPARSARFSRRRQGFVDYFLEGSVEREGDMLLWDFAALLLLLSSLSRSFSLLCSNVLSTVA